MKELSNSATLYLFTSAVKYVFSYKFYNLIFQGVEMKYTNEAHILEEFQRKKMQEKSIQFE